MLSFFGPSTAAAGIARAVIALLIAGLLCFAPTRLLSEYQSCCRKPSSMPSNTATPAQHSPKTHQANT